MQGSKCPKRIFAWYGVDVGVSVGAMCGAKLRLRKLGVDQVLSWRLYIHSMDIPCDGEVYQVGTQFAHGGGNIWTEDCVLRTVYCVLYTGRLK